VYDLGTQYCDINASSSIHMAAPCTIHMAATAAIIKHMVGILQTLSSCRHIQRSGCWTEHPQ
jgi:fumarate hydratase class II